MPDAAAITEDQAAPRPDRRIVAEVGGNRIEVLDSGAERLETLLGMIEGAERSLRLLFYMFSGDDCGEKVRDAMIRAVERGVDVRIIIDGFGSDVAAPFFEELREAGGHLCLFHPSYGRRYLLRNHQKLVVVDERIALTGGANINTEYFRDEGTDHWRDLWVSVEGPAVRPAARYFDALHQWTTTKGAKIRTLRRIIRRYSQRRGPVQWIHSGPMRRRNPWPMQLAKEIITGTDLAMIAAYFSPPFAMLRRIARLGRRGRARIITAAHSDNETTIAAARHTYARLLRNGVEMYEYQPAKLHTKLMIVGDVVHIGSANFDFRSLYLNLEMMLRIDDKGFAEQMRAYFEGEVADSLKITPQLHRQRATLLKRLKWTIAHFIVTAVDYTVTRRLNFTGEES